MNAPTPIFTPSDALKAAVEAVGGQAAMARLVGVKQPSVWNWLDKGKTLPAQHVLKVEGATGISRHDLRPDIYPRDGGPSTASGRAAAAGGAGGDTSTSARAEPALPDSLSGLSA